MTPAQKLTYDLRGKWHRTYGIARCVAHDDHLPSLSIRDGDHGIALKCFAGCSFPEIVTKLPNGQNWTQEPRQETEEGRKLRERQRAEAERRTADIVTRIWREARPIQSGDVADRYLKLRGLGIERPPSLRFHPALLHAETGLLLPALVAAIQASDRRLVGVLRTYLKAGGTGKASVNAPKMMLGSVTGGAVRLAAAAEHLAVSEGIESGFAFQQAQAIATWAALSTHGMKTIVLPKLPLASVVYLVIDADEAGEHAAQVAAERFDAEGRRVILARPTRGKDMNDSVVMAHGA